jgi:flagellar assembly protein FliH
LSSQFKPTATFIDSDNSEGTEKKEPKAFKLMELVESSSQKNRTFSFDSESARNFDKENISIAKQGVKELMADAITRAKKQAIEIKDNAYKEGHETGYDEGFKAAFQKGKTSAKEEFTPLLETLNSLIQELSGFRKLMYPKVENEMVGMIVDLTKKVLAYEISSKEDSVKQMILLAMNSVIDKENMVIRIHPSDKGYAEEFCPELKRLFSEIKNITFEEYSGIERGGCIIDTNFGSVDAQTSQLEEQIDKILKLIPNIPEVKSGSKNLSDGALQKETMGKSTDSNTSTSEIKTDATDESTDSNTSTSEIKTDTIDESTDSNTSTSEIKTDATDESTDSNTSTSEIKTDATDESTDKNNPEQENLPEGTA